MHKSLPVTALLVIAAAASSVFSAEKELFSNIRSGSVFAPPSGTVSTTPTLPQQGLSKVTSTEQLVRILTEAGFTATQDDIRTVSTNASAATWSLPVEITFSDDKSRLTIAIFLSVIEKEESLTTVNLLAMLDANRKHAPASFAYNSELKRFEIDEVLTNHNITANVLRNAIDGLAKIAAETEGLWKVPTTTQGTATTGNSDAAPSLVGQWSATRSKTEAFAIQFKGDNTFVLVYVNNGKQTKSSGKYTISGGKLTLEGEDGFRLAGTIKSTDEKQFQFAIENSKSDPLAFQRAK